MLLCLVTVCVCLCVCVISQLLQQYEALTSENTRAQEEASGLQEQLTAAQVRQAHTHTHTHTHTHIGNQVATISIGNIQQAVARQEQLTAAQVRHACYGRTQPHSARTD